MKLYHMYFFLLKLIILLIIALISLKIIKVKNKFFILIDFIFKLSLGIFIIIYFSSNNFVKLTKEDRILFVLSGLILILLIDYIEVINVLFNKHIKDERCLCELS